MKRVRAPTRRRSAPTPAESARAPTRGAPARGPGPTYDDLIAIVRLIESGSRFSEFRLRSGDLEVEIKRANGAVAPTGSTAPTAEPAAPANSVPPAAVATKSTAAAANLPTDAHVIRSPMVGTFYRSAEPGAPPFVEEGCRVEPDTVVCIIEVMKLMNSVTAGVSGVVTHVLVENAHAVEYGQALVAIKPE